MRNKLMINRRRMVRVKNRARKKVNKNLMKIKRVKKMWLLMIVFQDSQRTTL